jgi:hypothetical protein
MHSVSSSLRLVSLAALLCVAGCPSTNSPDDAGRTADARAGDDAFLATDAPGLDAVVVGEDAPSLVDAFRPPGDCTPMRVSTDTCGPLCDGPDRWYWDGERCVSIKIGRAHV